MAKNIIAIIGARKVGKTMAASLLHSFHADSAVITPLDYILQDFLRINEMSATGFHESQEENRNLLFLFKELQEQIQPKKYLHQFLSDLDRWETAIVEDIYSYQELHALIKLKAKIILMDASSRKRTEFGYTNNMDKAFYVQEVASIDKTQVKTWHNVTVIDNDYPLADLRLKLRNQT